MFMHELDFHELDFVAALELKSISDLQHDLSNIKKTASPVRAVWMGPHRSKVHPDRHEFLNRRPCRSSERKHRPGTHAQAAGIDQFFL